MPIAEDTSIYFLDQGMSVKVLYTLKQYVHVSNNSVEIQAFFNDEYITDEIMSGSHPELGVQKTSLPDGYSKGDKVRISEVDYLCEEFHPDSFGIVTIVLRKL